MELNDFSENEKKLKKNKANCFLLHIATKNKQLSVVSEVSDKFLFYAIVIYKASHQ